MPLYVCDHCRAVENTALGKFWLRRPRKLPVLCSECATGEWHGRFPKRQYDPEATYPGGIIVNRPEAA